jgi:eukaryotic-like serine/threonine-protein kinase
MDAEKWKKVSELYEAALDLPAEKQRVFVRDACAEDEELLREVESMLRAREKAGSFLGQPAAEEIGISLMKPASLVGKQLGVYAVEELIGAGGMGEVYLARDVKLRREVALKVLPAEYSADKERTARLEREARMLAALNHPNIAAIYALEEWEGQQVLVMELVEGQTLAERIADVETPVQPAVGADLRVRPMGAAHGWRPLPIDLVLDIGIQVAGALEAAHEKQIVHRDLKPATWTEEEMLVGTPAYMSPEQVRGEKADKEADIWAFGCLLYEMLTAKKAFSGKTITDTAAEVLKGEPDWSALPGSTPNALRKILERCLQKEASHRLRDIGDARIELEEILTGLKKLVKTESAVQLKGPTATSKLHRLWLWGASVVLVTLFFLGFWHFRQRKEAPETALTPVPLTSYPGSELHPSFSPDGNQVAFMWDGRKQDNWDVYIKQIGEEAPFRLTSEPAGEGDFSPAWSPDGRFIAFDRCDESGCSLMIIQP